MYVFLNNFIRFDIKNQVAFNCQHNNANSKRPNANERQMPNAKRNSNIVNQKFAIHKVMNSMTGCAAVANYSCNARQISNANV